MSKAVQSLNGLLSEPAMALPGFLSVGLADPQEDAHPLYPVEEAAIARALVKRRREFTAGRHAARQALVGMGRASCAIPMAEDRAPIWPDGVVGSVSHTDLAAIAVTALEKDLRSVGIDLEPDADMPEDLVPEVTTLKECRVLGGPLALAARRIFSAKEAAYKAQYPISRTVFGFQGMSVRDVSDYGITLTFAQPVPPFSKGDTMHVRQATAFGFTLSLALITH